MPSTSDIGDVKSYKELFDKRHIFVKKIDETTSQISKLYDSLVKNVHAEIFSISRETKGYEVTSSMHMIRILGFFGAKIDSVRFMDARTLIGGMNLQQERKDFFLSFIDSNIDLFDLTDNLIKTSRFQDSVIKNNIMSNIINGSRKSTIYRDLIVTFAARVESDWSICDQITYPSVTSNSAYFKCGTNSTSYHKVITMNYSNNAYYRYLFQCTSMDTQIEHNLYFYLSDKSNILFHECGHSVDCFTEACDYLGISKSIRDLAQKFTIVNINEQVFDETYDTIIRQNTKYHEDFICYTKEMCDNSDDIGIEKAIELAKDQASSAKALQKYYFRIPWNAGKYLALCC